jgi:hypothetical protein
MDFVEVEVIGGLAVGIFILILLELFLVDAEGGDADDHFVHGVEAAVVLVAGEGGGLDQGHV